MSDLIDRQALMKEFSDFVRASNNSDFARTPTWNDAVSLVGSMPSAQSTMGQVFDDDCVSRQAAIDAIDKEQKEIGVSDVSAMYAYSKCKAIIKQLPPAQPEPSQVAKDIARIVGNENDMRVIAQGRIRGRWIPVGGALYQCDQCGVVSLKRKFCSECGADMREVTT